MIEAGDEFGPSAWLPVAQDRIDAFALATEDRDSIHVSPELAAAGPYGMIVAHGFLTLALIGPFWHELTAERLGYRAVVNYGLNRVRFPAPVPTGARVRGRFGVQAVEPRDDGVQTTVVAVLEREGSTKPVCVAEAIFRLLW